MKPDLPRPFQPSRTHVTPGSVLRLIVILTLPALQSASSVLVIGHAKLLGPSAPGRVATFQPASASLPNARRTTFAITAKQRAGKRFGSLPLSFEANYGQTDSRVKFLAHGRGYSVFLTSTEAIFAFHRGSENVIARMRLVGANAKPQIEGLDELPGSSNYFIGNDPKKWRTNVPTYRKVTYKGVYPGIDLVYYGQQGELEYGFVLAPNADPSRVELAFEGPDGLVEDKVEGLPARLDKSGFRLHNAAAYQPAESGPSSIAWGLLQRIAYQGPWTEGLGGKRALNRELPIANQWLDGAHALTAGSQPASEIPSYDNPETLITGPHLDFSTYFGGSGDENGNAIALDSSGNVFITGRTDSVDFPVTKGTYQKTYGGNSSTCEAYSNCGDAFVTKLDSAGTTVLYSTYIGGSNDEAGYAIAVDSAGGAYITGSTDSLNFPTTPGAFQTTCKGCSPPSATTDAFVTKLNPAGSALVYSTFLGGSNGNAATGMAVDAGQNAYVVGTTSSADFPVTSGAYLTTMSNSISNAFISKLNSGGTALIYSTYLGGSAEEGWPAGIGVDMEGNAYVTGLTYSPDFPTTPGTFSIPYGLGFTPGSIPFTSYLTKLNSTGSALAYSLLLSGATSSVVVDQSGSAYVVGYSGQFFPTTPGALDGTCDTGGFLSRFTPDGSKLFFSDYFCGEANSASALYGFGTPAAVAVDSSANVYVAGTTGSTSFPATAGAFQTQIGNVCCFFDGFLMRLTPDGAALGFSTYLGGNSSDQINGLSTDASGHAYMTGYTDSTNFPTKDAIQGSLSGPSDAFITKIFTTPSGPLSAWPAVLSFGDQGVGMGSSPLRVTLANIGRSSVAISSITADGNFMQTNDCPSTLRPGFRCSIGVVFKPRMAGTVEGALAITPGGSERPITVELSGNGVDGPVVVFTPANPSWAGQPIGFTSPPLTITLTNAGNEELDVSEVTLASGPTFGFPGFYTCFVVEPQSSCTFQVTFTPPFSFGEGATYGSITLQDNAGTGSQGLQLLGMGAADGVTFSSLGLKFADGSVGGASGSQSVFLINGLSTAIILNSISAPPDFSETNNCGTTLASGAYCTLNVRFTPISSGVHLEPLTVNDTGTGSPHTLWLLGASLASELTVSPQSLEFLPQGDHTTSEPQAVVLANTNWVAISISSIVTSGDFAETNDCGNSLGPGAQCEVSVTFTPKQEGVRKGYLSFGHNGSGPEWVSLVGTGIPRS